MEGSASIEFSHLKEGEDAQGAGCGKIRFRLLKYSTDCGGCVLLIVDWFSCVGSNFDGKSVGYSRNDELAHTYRAKNRNRGLLT